LVAITTSVTLRRASPPTIVGDTPDIAARE
jgi:hypothetical protein